MIGTDTAKVIRVWQFGGPDVFHYEDVPNPACKSGQALVQIDTASINLIDT